MKVDGFSVSLCGNGKLTMIRNRHNPPCGFGKVFRLAPCKGV